MSELKYHQKYIAKDKSHYVIPQHSFTDLSGSPEEVKVLCRDDKLQHVAYTITQLLANFDLLQDVYPKVSTGSLYQRGREVHRVYGVSLLHDQLDHVSLSTPSGNLHLSAVDFYKDHTRFTFEKGMVLEDIKNDDIYVVESVEFSSIKLYVTKKDKYVTLPDYRVCNTCTLVEGN